MLGADACDAAALPRSEGRRLGRAVDDRRRRAGSRPAAGVRARPGAGAVGPTGADHADGPAPRAGADRGPPARARTRTRDRRPTAAGDRVNTPLTFAWRNVVFGCGAADPWGLYRIR